MKFSSGAPVDFGRANPVEWNSFVRYEPLRALSTEVGFGTGIGKGYGSPDYRAYFGLAYTPGSSERITRTRVVRKASKPAKAKAATKKPRRKVVVTSSSSARKPPARR